MFYGQNIEDVFKDINAVREFVKQDFDRSKPAKTSELFMISHYMQRNKHNRFMRYRDMPYFLYGQPIREMFGYEEGTNGICLYILVRMESPHIIEKLVENFGEPDNTNLEEMKEIGITFCVWELDNYVIYFSRAYGLNCGPRDMLIRVYNYPKSASWADHLHVKTLLFSDGPDYQERDYTKYPVY